MTRGNLKIMVKKHVNISKEVDLVFEGYTRIENFLSVKPSKPLKVNTTSDIQNTNTYMTLQVLPIFKHNEQKFVVFKLLRYSNFGEVLFDITGVIYVSFSIL